MPIDAKLSDAAIWYASRMGWAVIPVHTVDEDGKCSCGASSCRSAGKHPRTKNGSSDATTDRAKIRDWWRRWPNANIGIATGEVSGLVVLDVDPRNGGNSTLRELEADKRVPRTLVARTGGGGRHFYCQYPDATINFKLGRGIDVKADGGFVVAAPSVHVSGNVYTWLKRPSPDLELKRLPNWALYANGSAPKENARRPNDVLRNGERNVGLASYAGRLRRAGAGEPEIVAALLVHNRMYCEPPLDEPEVRSIARSISRYDTPTQKVEHQIAQQSAIALDADRMQRALESLREDGILPHTDLGNAKRFVRLHGEDVRHTQLGWLTWNGKFWEPDKLNQVRQRAYDVSTLIRAEALQLNLEGKELDAILRKADAAEQHQATTALLGQAAALSDLSANISTFDTDPMLFNVQNGTLDLRSGLLREHEREDYMTRISPVTYDRRARAPRFMQFLDETFGDAELIAFMQRLLGYCLTGLVTEQVFPIFWGKGGNGKGKLVEDAMGCVFGPDYMVSVHNSLIRAKNFSNHPTEATVLRGARLAYASESSSRLDEEMIKRLTGGDTISARYMHKDFFTFTPTHTLMLLTNVKPRTSSGDAIWRRLQLIPFENKPKVVDRDLGDKLKTEASGILNWLLRGCLIWQRNGLNPPEKVIATTAAHREAEDVFGMFLAEKVEGGDGFKVWGDELYNAYSAWCIDYAMRGYGKIRFYREIAERFPDAKKYLAMGRNRWEGLRLTRTKSKQ